MNEDKCVAKENPNPAKAKELAQLILNESISDQNEIFETLRNILIDARIKYIKNLQNDSENLIEQINYASSTLDGTLMVSVKK